MCNILPNVEDFAHEFFFFDMLRPNSSDGARVIRECLQQNAALRQRTSHTISGPCSVQALMAEIILHSSNGGCTHFGMQW